jgi:predicted enzyme related to lactoylglutathione lyase
MQRPTPNPGTQKLHAWTQQPTRLPALATTGQNRETGQRVGRSPKLPAQSGSMGWREFDHVKNSGGVEMLRGLTNVSFWADDVVAAGKWYADVLGIEPYFQNPAEGPPAYIEFRLGAQEDELGIIDRRYAPPKAAHEPGGAIVYWQVDDVAATFARLLERGASEYQPVIERGTSGFVTASVVDPFGNVLGLMYSPHFLDMQGT